MTFAEMLRGSPLNQQRMADDNAMNLAGMLARGRAGTVRQEPSLMQEIGGAITDYAVPDRYSDAITPSVMSPKLGSLTGVKEDGVPYSMADAPNPVPMLMDTMPMAGITAFHGSPHKFSKFDMSKIGTGEGAQAYGHGLYFAENPRVAKDYKEKLGNLPNMIHYDGTPLINLPAGEKEALNQLERAMPIFKGPKVGGGELGFSDSVEFARNKMKDNPAGTQFLDNVDESKIAWGDGNLYKVDIPDDQIAKMLDWDKPLSEQPHIADQVQSLGLDKKDYTMPVNYPDGSIGETSSGSSLYRALVRKMGGGDGYAVHNSSGASEIMQQRGIPGIKYLDGGSRTGGQGTSNFVLFADDIAKILERNDQPIGDLAEGLQRK